MIKKAQYAVPYAQVVILDPKGRVQVPKWTKDATFVATDTCIYYGCRPDIDGETAFTLGQISEVDPGAVPTFQGMLRTPTRKIALETSDGLTILESNVLREETMVRIWASHPTAPDRVVVGFE